MIFSKYTEFNIFLRKPPMFIWAWKIQFWDFFHENLHACIVFMYKNKNNFFLEIFRFWKKYVFFSYQPKIYLFLNGQEKSNFQNFSNKFCISLDDVKNYLNILFYEKNLKIGFFLAKKRRPKKHFLKRNIEKSPIFRWAGKIQFSKFFNQNLYVIRWHPRLPKYKFS